MRLTGTVLNVEHVSGISKGSGNAYSFYNVRVLVAATRDVVTAQISTNPQPVTVPKEGELVDYSVRVGAYRDQARVDIVAAHVDREPVLLG